MKLWHQQQGFYKEKKSILHIDIFPGNRGTKQRFYKEQNSETPERYLS